MELFLHNMIEHRMWCWRPRFQQMQNSEQITEAVNNLRHADCLDDENASIMASYAESRDALQDDLVYDDKRLIHAGNALRTLCEESPWPQAAQKKDLKWLDQASKGRKDLLIFWDTIRKIRMDHLEEQNRSIPVETISRSAAIRAFDHYASIDYQAAMQEEATAIRDKAWALRQEVLVAQQPKEASTSTATFQLVEKVSAGQERKEERPEAEQQQERQTHQHGRRRLPPHDRPFSRTPRHQTRPSHPTSTQLCHEKSHIPKEDPHQEEQPQSLRPLVANPKPNSSDWHDSLARL